MKAYIWEIADPFKPQEMVDKLNYVAYNGWSLVCVIPRMDGMVIIIYERGDVGDNRPVN